MRFTAPIHVSSVYTTTYGEIKVEDGVAVLPDDAPTFDQQALLSVGFVLETQPAVQEVLKLELPGKED